VEHAVGTDQGLAPGLGAEQTGVTNQVHRTNQQLVQALDGHFDAVLLVQLHRQRVPCSVGVATEGGEEVAQPTFGGVDAVGEAKAAGIVGIARIVQVAQGLGPGPAVADLPAVEEKEG
jgi:hypothetical protein